MKPEPVRKSFTLPRAVRVPGRAPSWMMPTVRTILTFLDLVLVSCSFLFAFYVRQGAPILSPGGGLQWSPAFAPYGALVPIVIVIRLLTMQYYNLYRMRGEFSFFDDGLRIFKAVSIGSLLIVATAFLYRGGFQYRAFSYARGVFVLDFLFSFVVVSTAHFAIRGIQMLVRRRGINLIPTLVVGRGAEAALCIKETRDRPALGYRVIGVIENGPLNADVPEYYQEVPVIGDFTALPDAVRDSGANEVIIADANVNGDALFDVMVQCGRRRGIEFRIAPNLINCLPRKTEIDQIGSLPMITLFREPLSQTARLVKRLFDITVATLVLLIFSPLWLLIVLLIKLDSRGPVFYVQERVGMDGRIFLFYKLRTMQTGADDAIHREFQKQYIAGAVEGSRKSDERPLYKLSSDPRVTRVGRWLRRTSLDEIPQLLNVLRGDMSIVGPRPPIPYEVESYDLWHRKRLEMKPGVTGLWQVSGRNRLLFEEMVKLDLFYIENWSLLLDLKIILRTGVVMFKGDGY